MIFNPRENHILRALGQSEFELLAPHLELVNLPRAEVLFDVYDQLNYVYFPITSIASLLCYLEDGTGMEVGTIGNEGCIGVSALTGGRALTQTVIKVEGHCYRISLKSLKSILARSEGRRTGILKKLMLRYVGTLFIQVSQATVCNRRHNIEQQLCSWLLLNFDRIHSSSLTITQESIAHLLGVRRESISDVAKKLRQAGIIDYRRSNFELKNKEELKTKACECYAVIKEESERLIIDLEAA
ncbi:Crp/Fnr family transcriptional regulator [Nitrosomonas sp. Nm166]|uniref:Crp/Fnr family transcriptional regulator n=1 Tax=Nitrosomonas sp. Nm166 TaxID=1881054 RepID=UPI0008F393A7|nr:Crp/Fnr family transcriptional regulator [Nitrosomonas sp. Nm166]SFF24785.1 cAMP-binding domain of CRP or a regulatory subunit of cAMP-dependent protein kinases [Nitrosomonas sp. Nm166]